MKMLFLYHTENTHKNFYNYFQLLNIFVILNFPLRFIFSELKKIQFFVHCHFEFSPFEEILGPIFILILVNNRKSTFLKIQNHQ